MYGSWPYERRKCNPAEHVYEQGHRERSRRGGGAFMNLVLKDLSLVPIDHSVDNPYRGASIIRNSCPRGPCSRNILRALRRPKGGGAVPERGSPLPTVGHPWGNRVVPEDDLSASWWLSRRESIRSPLYVTDKCSDFEAGSFLRRKDLCITQV